MGSADQLLERLTDVPLSTYDHRQRRAEELHWVRTQGQAASLLEAYDEVRAARTAGVTVGPGMGSTHASLLLWCMGLTEFDPVVWSLPPSTFYRIGPRVHHARWYVSASPRQSGHLQFDPLVAALARQQATPEERTPLRENVTGGPWSFTRYPSARWILALAPAPSFDDRVCAAALARPGPAGCGMLQTYLSRPWQSRGTLLPHILSVSRGVLLFREQVHAMGSALPMAWTCSRKSSTPRDTLKMWGSKVPRDCQGRERYVCSIPQPAGPGRANAAAQTRSSNEGAGARARIHLAEG